MYLCSEKCPLETNCEGVCFYPNFRIKTPTPNTPEPDPVKNNHPAVWDLVLKDMAERDAIGEQKYGTRLQPHNGRDALVDLYQELLDAVVYIRQTIYERDNK